MDGFSAISEVAAISCVRPAPRPDRKALLVLGMSRSGTSMISHLLHVLGAALPDQVTGSGYGNPLGHWEPRALGDINDRFLTAIDRAWDDARPLPERCFRGREAYAALRLIAEEIRRGYGDEKLIVIKDPRVCRLLPLYLEALDMLDIEPLVVHLARPLPEIAQSLADRDGLHPRHTEMLWLRAMTEAELHSRDCRRIWISYAALLNDWPSTVSRIAARFALAWPNDPDDVADELRRLVKPRFHHAVTGDVHAGRHDLAGEACEAIRLGIKGDDHGSRLGFDQVRAALRLSDELYLPAMTALLGRRDAALRAVRLSTSWRITAPMRGFKRWLMRAWGRKVNRRPQAAVVRPAGLEPATERL